MNSIDLIYVILISFSLVYFLNKHHGKHLLFRIFYPHVKTTPVEYIRDTASRRFTKLWSCYFCQGAHVAHALAWGYGWWSGLSLAQTCYLVLLATPVAACASEIIIGFFDDVQQIVKAVGRQEPVNAAPSSQTPRPTSVQKSGGAVNGPNTNVLEAYVAERKKRGYDIDIVERPDGKQAVMVNHVPERERFWEAFYAGKPSVEIPELGKLWDRLKSKWEDEECTRCEKNAIVTEHREEALALIDAFLRQRDGKNNTKHS